MKIVRIYSGDDGKTHFQDLDVDAFAKLAVNLGQGDIRVNQGGRPSLAEFHNAPRRQYVVMLSGVTEIEIGDGSKRQLERGDVLVAEDLTGQGHITRSVGQEARVSLAMPLPGA
jgi:quercetin dioxygenase-like cupin family protein